MSIATVLSETMDQENVTQESLAKKVGVSQSYISQICSGKKVPTISVLSDISASLGISIASFFAEDEEAAQELSQTTKLVLSGEERELIQFYRLMDRRNRAVLKGIISSYTP